MANSLRRVKQTVIQATGTAHATPGVVGSRKAVCGVNLVGRVAEAQNTSIAKRGSSRGGGSAGVLRTLTGLAGSDVEGGGDLLLPLAVQRLQAALRDWAADTRASVGLTSREGAGAGAGTGGGWRARRGGS